MLNEKNQIQAIKMFAIPIILYMADVIGWAVHECAELDRLTRKQLTLFKALHPLTDIDGLYVSLKKSGRGLFSFADVVSLEKHSLSVYVTKSTEPIMVKISNHLQPIHWQIVTPSANQLYFYNTYRRWRSKALHSQWPKLMDELWADLQNTHLKPVTEPLLVAAQDQTLNTNWLSFHILRNTNSDLCRRCKMLPDTIEHIVVGCPVITWSLDLYSHNAVASAIHWSLCTCYGFPQSEQLWQHQPQPVLDNDEYKLLHDCNIFTDKKIQQEGLTWLC